MTKFVIVTLNLPVGSGIGPTMVLTADIGIVTPNTLTLAELLAGALVEIDVLATTVTVTSQGGCVNSTIIPAPTTTTTTLPSCNCIYFIYPPLDGGKDLNISYIDCDDILIEDTIKQGTIVETCGHNPVADGGVIVIERTDIICDGKGGNCLKCNCHLISNPTSIAGIYSYLQCNEAGRSYIKNITLSPGSSTTICAIPQSITTTPGLVVTDLENICLTPGDCA